MAQVIVSNCKCKHDYQDKRYGQGNRLFNIADKQKIGNSPALTCTVCGDKKAV